MDSEDSKVTQLEQAISIRPTRPKKTRISSKYNDSKYIKKIQKGAISSDDITAFKKENIRRYTDDDILDIKRSGKQGCHSLISDGVHFKLPINARGLDELEKNNFFEEMLDELELAHFSSCFDYSESGRQSRRGQPLDLLLENDILGTKAAKDLADYVGMFMFNSLKAQPQVSESTSIDFIVFNKERIKHFTRRNYEQFGSSFEQILDRFTEETINATRKDAPICLALPDARPNNFIKYDRDFGNKPNEEIGVNDQGLRKSTIMEIMERLELSTKDRDVNKYRRQVFFGQPFAVIGYLNNAITINKDIGVGVKDYLRFVFDQFVNTGMWQFSDGTSKLFPEHDWKSARMQFKLGEIIYDAIDATDPNGTRVNEAEEAMRSHIYYMKSHS